MERTMRKKLVLNALLVLSLSLLLGACGGGGDNGGGEVCYTTDYTDSDLIGTWADPTAACVQPPQNSPCNMSIPGSRPFNNLLAVTTTSDPDWQGTIQRDPDGQVHLIYTTFDVNFNTTNGDIFGKLTCDKNAITFTQISWSTSNTGPGQETISRTFTRQ